MIGNIGLGELILILIIGILVTGPKRTIEIARTLGRVSRQLRDLSQEFTSALQAEIDATETEAGNLETGLRKVAADIEGALSGAASAGSTMEESQPAPPPQAEPEEIDAPATPSPALESEAEAE